MVGKVRKNSFLRNSGGLAEGWVFCLLFTLYWRKFPETGMLFSGFGKFFRDFSGWDVKNYPKSHLFLTQWVIFLLHFPGSSTKVIQNHHLFSYI
jgi:hypothetical protein